MNGIRRNSVTRRTVLARPCRSRPLGAAPRRRAEGGNWPSQPMRVIVAFPAGDSIDVMSRLLAEQMQKWLGQPFVVENQPGARGDIHAEIVAEEVTPDGYTKGPRRSGTC